MVDFPEVHCPSWAEGINKGLIFIQNVMIFKVLGS